MFVYENTHEDTELWALMAMEVANYGMSTVGNQCFFARLAEYHGGDKALEKEFLDVANRHISHSHCCGMGHWRVPSGCYYVEHDLNYRGGHATTLPQMGFKYY